MVKLHRPSCVAFGHCRKRSVDLVMIRSRQPPPRINLFLLDGFIIARILDAVAIIYSQAPTCGSSITAPMRASTRVTEIAESARSGDRLRSAATGQIRAPCWNTLELLAVAHHACFGCLIRRSNGAPKSSQLRNMSRLEGKWANG